MFRPAHPESASYDKPSSCHERLLYRAAVHSPLHLQSPVDELQNPKSNHTADSTVSSGSQDSPRLQMKGQAKHHAVPRTKPARQPTWPPKGLKLRSKLTFIEAEALVGKGAIVFKGFAHQTPNVPFKHSRFYAFAGMRDGSESLEASYKPVPLIEGMSFALAHAFEYLMPWETLEQPSMSVCFGASPGTISLNYWVSLATRRLPHSETTSDLISRPMELTTIMDRLQYLENGLDDTPEAMETFLYSQLLYDPEMWIGENDMGQQIATLVAILDRLDWIDFSDPKDQVIAGLYENDNPNESHLFYHQLLLSIELHLRIQCAQLEDSEKRQFLSMLPDRVQWSIALARIWLSNVSIKQSHVSSLANSWDSLPLAQVIPHDTLTRIRQVEQLGWALKWPNMGKVCEVLYREVQGDTILQSSSVEAKSFLSGVILPGLSSSWLAIKCLIDCDARDGYKLKGLTDMHPQSGFQYRTATYWYWLSIVGKVLGAAKGVNQYGGWIGPCMHSPDFELCTFKPERVHCVIVNPVPVPNRLTKQKIKDMALRSDPVGPPDDLIPVKEFKIVQPKHDIIDTIRVEKLACPMGENIRKCSSDEPSVFNVAIKFAIQGTSYALRLRHDTSYIKAVPCNGIHVLFYDYTYKAIRVDELLHQRCWGGVDARNPVTATGLKDESGPSDPRKKHVDEYDNEAVLVVEALGVADNEVFARAWCSFMGLSAIIGNVEETCMACAIREAYAACVTVVILIEGGKNDDVEPVECSPPRPLKRRERKQID